jgi:hypothetical protein
MHSRLLLVVPLTLLAAPLLDAQNTQPEPPVPVTQAPPAADRLLLTPAGGENQKLYGSARGALISADAAKDLIARFRAAYAKDGAAPRIAVYVNRELVDTESGLQLTGHTEKYTDVTHTDKGQETTGKTKTSGTNTYAKKDGAKPTLADRQTVREIERLFGRVYRHAGAQLVDPKVAASLIADQPGRLTGDAAARDRQALSEVADIAIEVLISSKNLTVPGIAEDQTYAVPDLQVTAIRLKDSAVIGQASAADILGRGQQAGQIVRQFDVRDITEATAFALMEDMLTGK